MVSRVDFLASESHYAMHLAPIWSHLPQDIRGEFWTPEEIMQYPISKGIQPRMIQTLGQFQGEIVFHRSIVVVASWKDLEKVRNTRPQILSEHGIGQTYGNSHVSYAGGRGRENVRLFLCPNELVAQKNRRAWPQARIVVIGYPKMDEFYTVPRRGFKKTEGGSPVVAMSFHWDCTVCPESRSAFGYYQSAVLELAEKYKVIGHAHPRIWNQLSSWYREHGIEAVREFEDILRRADIYCVDNSSTLYEFASLDRPVVVMNAPWYRRTVHHGIRFWEYADIGVNCDRAIDLVDCVKKALQDPVSIRRRRREITDILFPIRDGSAGRRAAEAIVDLFRG